jgi:hypothetical protein
VTKNRFRKLKMLAKTVEDIIPREDLVVLRHSHKKKLSHTRTDSVFFAITFTLQINKSIKIMKWLTAFVMKQQQKLPRVKTEAFNVTNDRTIFTEINSQNCTAIKKN